MTRTSRSTTGAGRCAPAPSRSGRRCGRGRDRSGPAPAWCSTCWLTSFEGPSSSRRASLSRTAIGVFSECARLPTWVRARSTMRRLLSISALISLTSGAISRGNAPSSSSLLPPRMSSSARRTRVERPEPEHDGAGVDQQAAEPEDHEDDEHLPVEGADLLLEAGAVADDAEARGMAVVVEQHLGLGHLDLVAEGIALAIEALVVTVEGDVRRCSRPARRRRRARSRRAAAS